jgi:cob(I)alamin adenosyltransferase
MSDSPPETTDNLDGVLNDLSPNDVPIEDPRPSGLRPAKSLVLVHTGHGKGKSSSAFGVMLRALARDWPVAVIQFIKSGDWHVGEEKLGRQLGVQWDALGAGFTWESDNIAHDIELANQAWAHASTVIAAGAHRLVILDELTYLINWGWLDVNLVVEAIRSRPEKVSVVVTGRDAHQALIDIADTVTEMREIKHAYQQGIAAKKGIDY